MVEIHDCREMYRYIRNAIKAGTERGMIEAHVMFEYDTSLDYAEAIVDFAYAFDDYLRHMSF